MLRDGLYNRSWKDIDLLLEQATRWLKEFWGNPQRIHSLVGEGWMLHQPRYGCQNTEVRLHSSG